MCKLIVKIELLYCVKIQLFGFAKLTDCEVKNKFRFG